MSSLIIAAAGAGKSKDMKNESLSKFYVAVTRARYSVAFVYKTQKLPSNDIGTKWIPDVMDIDSYFKGTIQKTD